MSERPTLAIDALILRLPEGLAGRADAIARRTARDLARLPLSHSVELASVAVPVVRLGGGETEAVIARRIAAAIHRQILDRTPGRADHAG